MDAKWIFVAGLGAGAALALRLSEKQIASIKGFASDLYQSPSLEAAKKYTTDRVSQVLKQQGTNLIDKLADNLKQNLFDGGNTTETSTTSTINRDGHTIIDGKVVQ